MSTPPWARETVSGWGTSRRDGWGKFYAGAGVRTALLGDADGDDTGPLPARTAVPARPRRRRGWNRARSPSCPAASAKTPHACGRQRKWHPGPVIWSSSTSATSPVPSGKTSAWISTAFGVLGAPEPGLVRPRRLRRGRPERAQPGSSGRPDASPLSPSGSWNRLTPFLRSGPSMGGGPLQTDTTQTPGLISSRDVAPMVLDALGVPQPIQMTGAPAVSHPSGSSKSAPPGPPDAAQPRIAGRCLLDHRPGRGGPRLRQPRPLPVRAYDRPCRRRRPIRDAPAVRLASRAPARTSLADPHTVRRLRHRHRRPDRPAGTIAHAPHHLRPDSPCAGRRRSDRDDTHLKLRPQRIRAGRNTLLRHRQRVHGRTHRRGAAGGGTSPPRPTSSSPSRSGSPRRLQEESAAHRISSDSSHYWEEYPRSGEGGFFPGSPSSPSSSPSPPTARRPAALSRPVATFTIAWRLLQGKPATWKHLVGGAIAGFALVLLWAVLGHVLHLRRTHLETAVGALGHGRFGYILGVSLRKVGLGGPRGRPSGDFERPVRLCAALAGRPQVASGRR